MTPQQLEQSRKVEHVKTLVKAIQTALEKKTR